MARFNKPITLAQQEIKLRKVYPNLIDKISVSRNELSCVMRLQPTAESREYKVNIRFKIGSWPKVKLVDPKEIVLVDGKKPHHLYGRSVDGGERLCVFYPKDCGWTDNHFLADTFVPWVITWLSAYEIWQITGVWVYPEYVDGKPKQDQTKD
jgi:hypothetical protein